MEDKKETHISHCQVCGKNFVPGQTHEVYFAPTDNNIVCKACAMVHQNKQERVYKGDDK